LYPKILLAPHVPYSNRPSEANLPEAEPYRIGRGGPAVEDSHRAIAAGEWTHPDFNGADRRYTITLSAQTVLIDGDGIAVHQDAPSDVVHLGEVITG